MLLEMRLPSDKLVKLREVLKWFQGQRKVTKKKLQQLGGYLAHFSKVVKGGRIFSRRIYDMLKIIKKPYYKIRLNGEFRQDVQWWSNYAEQFNGKSKILGKFAPLYSVYSDASLWGFSAVCSMHWLIGTFVPSDVLTVQQLLGHHFCFVPDWISESHINVREMWAVTAAAICWGSHWKNSSILFITDNCSVQTALSTGKSLCKGIMTLLRLLFWLSVENNFEYHSVYIRSGDNILADTLSRLNQKGSCNLICNMDPNNYLCCAHIFRNSFF